VAQALLPIGLTAVLDADPRLPNARYYLGLPSWNYLSPVTAGESPAPDAETEKGLIVRDWSSGPSGIQSVTGEASVLSAEGADGARRPVEYAVIDAPCDARELIEVVADRRSSIILVARPGRSGFESAFVALKSLREAAPGRPVGLVVNSVPGEAYARAYHAKISEAARRLLSMEAKFLAGVHDQPGMAALQRERGPIVSSRPDALAALSLRAVAREARAMAVADTRATHARV
jgi:MinD-like ATPase involved in chromosome partitioning or flagellar assembly